MNNEIKFLTVALLATTMLTGWAQIVDGTPLDTDPTNAEDVKALLHGDNLKIGDILDFTVQGVTLEVSFYSGKAGVIIGGVVPGGAMLRLQLDEELAVSAEFKDPPEIGTLEDWGSYFGKLHEKGKFKSLSRNQKLGTLIVSERFAAQFEVVKDGLKQIDEVAIPNAVGTGSG
ncbi:MAG: hypothetical protein COA69_13425 [Robiginitomaculum sp.]|nr:MAG: hypothetical protein COA69_13425 [Robiginitomaculum sp.]